MGAKRTGQGLQQVGPGRWKVTVNIPATGSPDGRRHRRVAYVNGSKRDAERKRRQMLSLRDSGQLKPVPAGSLDGFLRAWLESKRSGLRPVASRTAERWETLIERQIVPYVGGLALREVSPASLRGLYCTLASEGYSGTTIHKVYALLRAAFLQGQEDGTVQTNPCRRTDAPKKDTGEATALDEAQAADLLDKLAGSPIYVPVLVALDCGLRRGELLALKWPDVDEESGYVTIRHAVEESRQSVSIKATKTGRVRSILLTKRAATALRQHRRTQARQRLAAGQRWHEQGLVFPAAREHRGKPAGRIWRPSSFSRTFRQATRSQGMRIGVHTLRHTMATVMLRAGRPTREVADRLGHSSTRLTSDLYQHVLRDQQEQGVAVLEAALVASGMAGSRRA